MAVQAASTSPPSTFQDKSTFEELSLIGNGAYGTVYRARDSSGHIVALKKVRVPITDGVPMSTLREVVLLKQLDKYEHPNIVRLLDVCHGQCTETEMFLFLVFEHLEQDLASYIENCPPPGLGSERVRDIMFQILSGVDFLHTQRVVHRDLKPQNILVSSNGVIKLADFGLAKSYDFEMTLTTVVVTLWYRSPEVLLAVPYATPVDIWSCGCIMAELLRLKPLFSGVSEGDQLDKIFRVLGTPSESTWPAQSPLPWSAFTFHPPTDLGVFIPECCSEGQDLLQSMLKFDPEQRISAFKALAHPYFREHGYNSLSK